MYLDLLLIKRLISVLKNKQMDIEIKIILLLSTCVLLVNTCGRGGRHSVGARVHGNQHRQTFHGRYDYMEKTWGGHVGGSVDNRGNWRVEAGVKIPVGKRSVQSHENRYNVTLNVDPCFFVIYDLDKNGEFSKDELQTIFGKDEKANALFADLDTDPSDGVITEEEFMTMAPLMISSCFHMEN
ncbi:uncharacterized protein LOC132732599 [Ruditapes philippinarum]|uniref:uncharacterized protein LOC132732599 n=1 Tax=Ruditapes philippinarum TaxID=129788 RepID=UPI00295B5C08|nr:uncharacterized protein LOC132732599 [Ruditapes philippinarum]